MRYAIKSWSLKALARHRLSRTEFTVDLNIDNMKSPACSREFSSKSPLILSCGGRAAMRAKADLHGSVLREHHVRSACHKMGIHRPTRTIERKAGTNRMRVSQQADYGARET